MDGWDGGFKDCFKQLLLINKILYRKSVYFKKNYVQKKTTELEPNQIFHNKKFTT